MYYVVKLTNYKNKMYIKDAKTKTTSRLYAHKFSDQGEARVFAALHFPDDTAVVDEFPTRLPVVPGDKRDLGHE